MADESRFPIQSSNRSQRDLTWSRSEKIVARKAFDAALKQELQEVVQEAKRMSNQIRQASDLWDLEYYLTQRRKEIDRKYDYRYSELTHVFGRLLQENRISEEELHGLRGDKLKPIHSNARLMAEMDAA